MTASRSAELQVREYRPKLTIVDRTGGLTSWAGWLANGGQRNTLQQYLENNAMQTTASAAQTE